MKYADRSPRHFIKQIRDPELWQRNPVQQLVVVLSIERFWPLDVLNNAAVPRVANKSSVDVPVRPKYTPKTSVQRERVRKIMTHTSRLMKVDLFYCC